MKKTIFLLLLISSKVTADGAYIATSVEVLRVANTASNGKSFAVSVSGGDGSHLCEEGQILFPLANAGNLGNDADIHSRAFSLAITALTTGKRVSIYSYADGSVCNKAAYLELLR